MNNRYKSLDKYLLAKRIRGLAPIFLVILFSICLAAVLYAYRSCNDLMCGDQSAEARVESIQYNGGPSRISNPHFDATVRLPDGTYQNIASQGLEVGSVVTFRKCHYSKSGRTVYIRP